MLFTCELLIASNFGEKHLRLNRVEKFNLLYNTGILQLIKNQEHPKWIDDEVSN